MGGCHFRNGRPQSEHRRGLMSAFMSLLHRDLLQCVGFFFLFSKSTKAQCGVLGSQRVEAGGRGGWGGGGAKKTQGEAQGSRVKSETGHADTHTHTLSPAG